MVAFGIGLKGDKNVKWVWSLFMRWWTTSSDRRRSRLHDNGGQGMCVHLVVGELERLEGAFHKVSDDFYVRNCVALAMTNEASLVLFEKSSGQFHEPMFGHVIEQ